MRTNSFETIYYFFHMLHHLATVRYNLVTSLTTKEKKSQVASYLCMEEAV